MRKKYRIGKIMKKLITLKMVLIALAINGVALKSEACDKHHDQTAQSVSLPNDSLYNLNSKWSDQKANSESLSSLAGKPRIIAMVYTKCQSACPLLVHDIKSMTSKISKPLAEKIQIDLFSFDSETENAKSLQAFIEKYKLDNAWSAHAGSKESVAELAAALGVQYKKLPSGDYIHSNVVFFLNEKGEVVAKHEGLGKDVSEFIKKIEGSL
jgi:protein SCO1